MNPPPLQIGRPEPLGAHIEGDGVNFAVWSHHAQRIELCLFDVDGKRELARYDLPGRSGDVFHGRLPGAVAGTVYGYRAHGPYEPRLGHRFNPNKLLIDPYARELVGTLQWHDAILGYEAGHPDGCDSFDGRDSAPYVPKSRVCGPTHSLSRRLPKPGRPWGETVLYEMHVRGFTRLHPGIPQARRGTIEALADPASIAHLKRLGVTAVELLPIAAWIDELHLVQRGLSNYWGYNPIAFFAMQATLAGPRGIAAMVDAVERLHEAGIEVLLDVVFNHTAEGDERGPTLSLRGLDNASYYLADPHRPGGLRNLSGCGNTLAAHQPAVSALIVDALRFWALEVGVDGFRFDLASAIARNAHGQLDTDLPWMRAVREDPALSRCKWVAEAWDCEGHFVGAFPPGWSEWNDRYRDDLRRFWRGDTAQIGALATRLAGSSDLFSHSGRTPAASIDFITAHDGMTLADLVSYRHRRNEANGENNRDGHDNDLSDDCGIEGPTNDADVVRARRLRMRALLASLMLSRGVPMLRSGDEFSATQLGNNNAYCHDGPLTWLKWPHTGPESVPGEPGANHPEDHSNLLSTLARLRAELPCLRGEWFLSGHASPDQEALPDVTWLGTDGQPMGDSHWHDPTQHSLACLLDASRPRPDAAHDRVWIGLTARSGTVRFELPLASLGSDWVRVLDTSSDCPALHIDPDGGLSVEGPAVVLCVSGAIGAHELSRWQVGLPAAVMVEANDPAAAIDLVIDADQTGPLPSITLHLDPSERRGRKRSQDPGQTLTIAAPVPSPATRIESVQFASRRLERHRIPIGHALAAGTGHVLALHAHPPQRVALYVAPAHGHLPDELVRPQGCWAISAQLYSIRTSQSWGIGDFDDLGALIEQAAVIGAAGVLVSPLHAPSLGWPDRGSPYSPSSRLALNPLFVSLPLAAAGMDAPGFATWLQQDDTRRALAAVKASSEVDYPRVLMLKRAGLERLWTDLALPSNSRTRQAFDAWWSAHATRLRAHVLFEAVADVHRLANWREWPIELSSPDTPAAQAFERLHEARVSLHAFIQWIAHSQWYRVGERASDTNAGIGPIADLAVGVDASGADAWALQGLMAAGFEVGAPPDPFCLDGQAWGLPPWRPDAMSAQGQAPFASLLEANMAGSGGLRIDHVMALERLFWVPQGGKAVNGAYVPYPLEALLQVVTAHSARHQCLVIGEDLGTVRPGLRERLARAGVLSYKVAWFERDPDGSLASPTSLPALAAACASTHDLPTIEGWALGRDIDEREASGEFDAASAHRERESRKHDLQGILAGLDRHGLHGEDLTERLHRWLAASSAGLAIVQLEDVTGLKRQPNLPGTPDRAPNWRQKLPVSIDELHALPRWRALEKIFSRRSLRSQSN